MLFVIVLFVVLLEILKNKSLGIKKIILYAMLEYLNFIFKYFSVYVHQNEYILYCITSTIFTILFQTSIFQNEYHIVLIVIKHLSLWHLFDDKYALQNFSRVAIILGISIICICTLFEKIKR